MLMDRFASPQKKALYSKKRSFIQGKRALCPKKNRVLYSKKTISIFKEKEPHNPRALYSKRSLHSTKGSPVLKKSPFPNGKAPYIQGKRALYSTLFPN